MAQITAESAEVEMVKQNVEADEAVAAKGNVSHDMQLANIINHRLF